MTKKLNCIVCGVPLSTDKKGSFICALRHDLNQYFLKTSRLQIKSILINRQSKPQARQSYVASVERLSDVYNPWLVWGDNGPIVKMIPPILCESWWGWGMEDKLTTPCRPLLLTNFLALFIGKARNLPPKLQTFRRAYFVLLNGLLKWLQRKSKNDIP